MHPYRSLLDAFEGSAAERDAYDIGLDSGHGLACHNVPEIGTNKTEFNVLTLDAESTLADWHEAHSALCYEAELHARCFSPWEQIAAGFNSYDEDEDEDETDAESLWEAYEAGVDAAIKADVASYTLADYVPHKREATQ